MRTRWGGKRDGGGITGLPLFHDSLRTSVASRTSNRERVSRSLPSRSLDTLCCISFYRVSLSNSDIVNLVPSWFQLFLTDGLETRSRLDQFSNVIGRDFRECNGSARCFPSEQRLWTTNLWAMKWVYVQCLDSSNDRISWLVERGLRSLARGMCWLHGVRERRDAEPRVPPRRRQTRIHSVYQVGFLPRSIIIFFLLSFTRGIVFLCKRVYSYNRPCVRAPCSE